MEWSQVGYTALVVCVILWNHFTKLNVSKVQDGSDYSVYGIHLPFSEAHHLKRTP